MAAHIGLLTATAAVVVQPQGLGEIYVILSETLWYYMVVL